MEARRQKPESAPVGLIADIGATNARFALVDDGRAHSEHILKCADFPTITEAVQAYLNKVDPAVRPVTASFAMAGPVLGDWFEMTNHPWAFSIEKTRKALGLEQFHLMNDFAALALAVPCLSDMDLHQIGTGTPKPGRPIGVIGPGTGLGVASLVHDGNRYVAVPGEGGHVTVPAATQREFDVLNSLYKEYGHVSAERVCSGQGLYNIYEAIRLIDGRDDLPRRTPAEISAAAMEGSCPACKEALDMMIGFLGSVAGNLALTLGATGGIYIAGGIVVKLGAYFHNSDFRESFLAKGRFRDYLDPVPTFVIQHPFPAFVGLAADIANLCSDR